MADVIVKHPKKTAWVCSGWYDVSDTGMNKISISLGDRLIGFWLVFNVTEVCFFLFRVVYSNSALL